MSEEMNDLYLKIPLTIFLAILLPDFLLSLSGRDTYLFYHFPILVNVGKILLTAFCITFLLEIIFLLIKQKWIVAGCYCFGAIMIFVVCKLSVDFMVSKSVLEARQEIERFLISKDISDGDGRIVVENNAMPALNEYLKQNFSISDLELQWKSPQFGKYEFRVVFSSGQYIYVRLSTFQNNPNKMWIHK